MMSSKADRMSPTVTFLILLGALSCAIMPAPAAAAPPDKKRVSDEELWELKTLFPEKGLFGPSARSTRISATGRYGAYLYRPYEERRHGYDLWLYDFQADQSTRVTSVSVMAPFQYRTRVVRDDRIKKLKQQHKDKKEGAQQDEKKDYTGDEIPENDAEDEKAPRYSGISSYTWHPMKDELLFTSEGDIYQWTVGAKAPIRLTMTESRESGVAYLPDGSGYTYQRDDAVFRVIFGDSVVRQLTPALPSGQRVSSYRLSPDGTRLAVTVRAGARSWSGARQVDIIRYRDRFAKAEKVSRTVSDDEIPKQEIYVYLYDLRNADTEESDLIEVFHGTIDGPRDIISSPHWSLDNEQVTFCFFDQQTGHVEIRVAGWPEKEEDKDKKGDKPDDSSGGEKASSSGAASSEGSESRARPERKPVKHPAKVVYRFLHFGGPNTPSMVSPMFGVNNRQILFVSEQTGFRHVNLLDPVYGSVKPLTAGNFEVYVDRLSKDRKNLLVRTTKDHPARTHIYRVDIVSGDFTRISPADGTYSSVAVSDDGRRALANYVTYGRLGELVRIDLTKNPAQKDVTKSHPELAHRLTKSKPEFFSYENRHGHVIHGMMVKPPGWKATDKRPLLIYVYGGPLGTRKMVVDGSYSSDGYLFANYVARKHGYVAVVIDPRGVSGYGGAFENANFEQVGKPQVEDLVDGVQHLVKTAGVDPKRVGIHGWSFGGFQTQMCMYTEPDVFQVGIAGAGPTEWENYNAWYTSGTIGTSEPGKANLKKFSLRPLAKNLKGKLLLIHGVEDTNVLFQDTVAIYRELLKAGKETNVELFLDPTGGHGLGGDVKRLNKYRKYEEFLLRTLGKQ